MKEIISRKGAKAQSKENPIGGVISDGSIEVHRLLSLGMLDSVSQLALANALEVRGFSVNVLSQSSFLGVSASLREDIFSIK